MSRAVCNRTKQKLSRAAIGWIGVVVLVPNDLGWGGTLREKVWRDHPSKVRMNGLFWCAVEVLRRVFIASGCGEGMGSRTIVRQLYCILWRQLTTNTILLLRRRGC